MFVASLLVTVAACSLSEEVIDLLSASSATTISALFEAAPVKAVVVVVLLPEGIFLCFSLAVVFPSAVCLYCLAGEEVVVVTGSMLLCLVGSHSVAVVFSSAVCLVCLAGKEVAVLPGLMFMCLACSCSVAVVLVCWSSLLAVIVS